MNGRLNGNWKVGQGLISSRTNEGLSMLLFLDLGPFRSAWEFRTVCGFFNRKSWSLHASSSIVRLANRTLAVATCISK